jgi:hypothetical protein
MSAADFLKPPVCNGHPKEQALIRRWWHEEHAARGRLVWEYFLGDCYADAVWFPEAKVRGEECPGTTANRKYPIRGMTVVVCEAKLRLTPELIGQALVYAVLVRSAGANLKSTVVFAEMGAPSMKAAAEQLGLHVILHQEA